MRELVDDLRTKAQVLRAAAARADEVRQRYDADRRVAQQLADEAAGEYQGRVDGVADLESERRSIESTLELSRRDLNEVVERLVDLKHRLGRSVPADELLDPATGMPRPVPPAETDPAVRARLEQELRDAEQRVAAIQAEREPSEAKLAEARREVESARAAMSEALSELQEKRARVHDFDAPVPSAAQMVEQAAVMEQAARELEAGAGEVQRARQAEGLGLRAGDEHRCAEALAADADQRRQEAKDLLDRGDKAGAEAMIARASELDGLAVRYATTSAATRAEADHMLRDADTALADAERAERKAGELRARSDSLRSEVVVATTRANELRACAERLDANAKALEDAMRSGVAQTITIVDDDGRRQTIEVNRTAPSDGSPIEDAPMIDRSPSSRVDDVDDVDDVDAITGEVFDRPLAAPSDSAGVAPARSRRYRARRSRRRPTCRR